MKNLFAIILLSMVISASAQQSKNEIEPRPDIQFEETTHDFGTFKEGTMATCEFIFTNTGKAPLVLTNVQPSCGCTSPEWTREPIAPGAKGKIKTVYNSYSRPGAFQKYVTVTSNGIHSEITLTIKGIVVPIPVEPISPVRNQMNNDQ